MEPIPQIDCLDLKSPDKFREWLSTKNPSDVVGHRSMSTDCPLANFINDLSGNQTGIHYWPHVTDSRIGFKKTVPFMAARNAKGSCATPPWARKFIKLVDEGAVVGRTGLYGHQNRVTADTALAYLMIVEESH